MKKIKNTNKTSAEEKIGKATKRLAYYKIRADDGATYAVIRNTCICR